MKRIIGILVIVLVLYGLVLASDKNARTPLNHKNLAERLALYGLLTLGAGVLIVSGGIDLSIGSVFCLGAVSFGLLVKMPPAKLASIFLALLSVALAGHLLLSPLFSFSQRLFSPITASLFLAVQVVALTATLLQVKGVPFALNLVISVAEVGVFIAAYLLARRFQKTPPAFLVILVAVELAAVVWAAGAWGLHTGLTAGHQQLGSPLEGYAILLAVLVVLGGTMYIGFFHGMIITRLQLQPFIVTLCGLFIWRGAAYWLALPDPLAPVRGLLRVVSFGLFASRGATSTGSAGNVGIGEQAEDLKGLIAVSADNFQIGFFEGIPVLEWFQLVPWRLCLFLGVAALLGVMLHASVYGRYLFAIGGNEQAARYAGVRCERYKVLAYILCSLLAGVAGILHLLELQTVSPSRDGSFYELYAITGAVLGGCSLRGGEGTVIGMLLGAAVLPLLRNLVNLANLPSDLEFTVIGVALLLGTIIDELLKRRAARRH